MPATSNAHSNSLADLKPSASKHLFVTSATVAVNASKDGGWGDPTSRVFLLVSEDRGQTFEVIPLSDAETTASNWFPSLERTTGHNRVPLPHLVYTIGESGTTTKDPIDTEIRAVTLER